MRYLAFIFISWLVYMLLSASHAAVSEGVVPSLARLPLSALLSLPHFFCFVLLPSTALYVMRTGERRDLPLETGILIALTILIGHVFAALLGMRDLVMGGRVYIENGSPTFRYHVYNLVLVTMTYAISSLLFYEARRRYARD